MQIREILAFLEQKAPADTAEQWDHPGLLVDGGAADADTVVTALDATPAAIRFAARAGAALLITHHPVIFDPIRKLSAAHPAALALQSGVSVFCAHTNLDKASGGVNDTLAAALSLEAVTAAPDGMTRIGRLPHAIPAAGFAALVSRRLNTPVQYAPGSRDVRIVAVCGGAGSAAIGDTGEIDAYVTGEIKHHEFLAMAINGVTAVAAGHYATEAPVVDVLTDWLQTRFPALAVVPFYEGAPYRVLGQNEDA